MSTMLYILAKYWRKHKKNAFIIIFSGSLVTAVVCCALLSVRYSLIASLGTMLEQRGLYDMGIADVPETRELIEELTASKEITRGNVSVYGKMMTEGAETDFAYGSADEISGKLLNIGLEEGRLPENDGEVAVTRTALDAFFWTGRVGDSIVLNGREYTVVGIIDTNYDWRRLTGYSPFDLNWGPDREFVPPYPLPMIFVADDGAPAEYTVALIDGLFTTEDERTEYGNKVYSALPESGYAEFFGCEYVVANDLFYSFHMAFELDTQWTLIMAGIAGIIAALSVFSVLKGVFADRQKHVALLHRVGMSKQSITRMYAVECVVVIVFQVVFGLLLGIGIYSLRYSYWVGNGGSRVSAFTTDPLITDRLKLDPILVSPAFTVFITALAYVLMIVASNRKPREKISKAKAGGLFANFGAIFRQRGVTVIQTAALALICFGSLLEYVYVSDENKTAANDKAKEAGYYDMVYENLAEPTAEYYANIFNMKEDNIAEYYSCSFAAYTGYEVAGAGWLYLADDNEGRGASDEDIAGLENITATGRLDYTYIASDEKISAYVVPFRITDPEQQQDMLAKSSENLQDFFDEGHLGAKYLYNLSTRLADRGSISRLNDRVVSGAIDLDKLDSGEEIILVTPMTGVRFEAGETLEIASLLVNYSYGVGDAVSAQVKIGAIVELPRSNMAGTAPDDIDKLTFYAVNIPYGISNTSIGFLTTAKGAKALGLHNAAYTEVYSSEEIKGSIFPTSAQMTLKSLKNVERERINAKMQQYGEILMLAVLMMLLGFAAYFSGIGLKIRSRSYEIATLRSLGTPFSRIKARLFLDNLKIPVIAMTAASVGLVVVRGIMRNAFWKLVGMGIEFQDVVAGLNLFDEGDIAVYNELLRAIRKLKDKYFLRSAMWEVPVIIPILVLLAVICVMTVLLTLLALRRHRKSISDMMNEERSRQ